MIKSTLDVKIFGINCPSSLTCHSDKRLKGWADAANNKRGLYSISRGRAALRTARKRKKSNENRFSRKTTCSTPCRNRRSLR